MNGTNDKKQVLRRLFFSTLSLSAFTFGGGYVIVTLLKKKFVDECHWIEEDEMLDLVAIAQSAPGAIAVNGAIVVGYKLAGMLGAAVAITATIIPPFVIISVISVFYEAFRSNFLVSQMLAGMQAGVGAVIASVVWQMGTDVVRSKSAAAILIMAASFAAACLFEVNVVLVVLAAAAVGVVRTLLAQRRGKEG
ncbi:MAG TPA: chromate transporter [Candidatus Faecalibacterium intestinigallinarum]|uniref:Chromate transporter n=1 Tax=Candidatus Faecalibacterium intestinigallinarum TaxID=2838581 RepID=A0A9D1Q8E0_9FIRM|nr:chromate transporter [Candidatus Faecalibacterium intestinigallinarum]